MKVGFHGLALKCGLVTWVGEHEVQNRHHPFVVADPANHVQGVLLRTSVDHRICTPEASL